MKPFLKYLSSISAIIICLVACEKDMVPNPPTGKTNKLEVTTARTIVLSGSKATSGGAVENGDGVTSRGVCWSTTQNPTTADFITIDGSGTGVFTSEITGLSANTTYYIRSYATNDLATVYGKEVVFITSKGLPIVKTTPISDYTTISAISGGEVTDDGGFSVTARGVCWRLDPKPTIFHDKTSDKTGKGAFTSTLTGLSPGSTYYLRSYATNSQGTVYGNEISFTTINIVIGSQHNGGIVAYILESGDPGYDPKLVHGFVAAYSDQGLAEWGCVGTTVGANGTGLGMGLQNTQDILATCRQVGIAAQLCETLVFSGYSDWYLPSQFELSKIYESRKNIDFIAVLYGGQALSLSPYWSSVEYTNELALGQNFLDGSQNYYSKDSTFNVRAVRTF